MSAPRIDATRLRTWVFLVPAVLLLVWLGCGPKPWSQGVAAAEARGREPKPTHYAVTGVWYGAWVALPAALVLAALRRRATAPLPGGLGAPPPPGPRTERWFLRATGLAIVGWTAAANLPRLDQSLWDDEEKAMRFYTVGRCTVADNGVVRTVPTTWADVFFNYRQPNNHIFSSILGKASHDALAPPPDTPGRPYFSERALRWPAFAGGLLALFATGWLVASLGYGRASWVAMLLLALHPWFLRYLVEARGYSLVLAFGALALGCVVRALTDGRWRWWAGLAATQFLLLYTYPGTVYFVAWCQAGVLLGLALHPGGKEARRALWPRWLAALLLAAIPLVVLMAPCVPQLIEYLARHRDRAPVTAATWLDLGSLLFCGSTARSWDPSNPLSLGLADRLAAAPLAWVLAIGLLAALAAGVVRLARGGILPAALLPAIVLPAATFPLHAMVKGQPFYPWYAIGALPFVAVLAALGAAGGQGRAPLLRTLAGAVIVLGFGWLTAPQRAITCGHPVEPKRECVLLVRGTELNPFHQPADAPVTISFHQENRAYDPHQLVLDDPARQEAFDEAVAQAAKTGRRVFVEYGQEAYARAHFAHIFRRLDDPALFRVVWVFHGLEPQNTRKILKYVGPANGPP